MKLVLNSCSHAHRKLLMIMMMIVVCEAGMWIFCHVEIFVTEVVKLGNFQQIFDSFKSFGSSMKLCNP